MLIKHMLNEADEVLRESGVASANLAEGGLIARAAEATGGTSIRQITRSVAWWR